MGNVASEAEIPNPTKPGCPPEPRPEGNEPVILHVYAFPTGDNNYLSLLSTFGFGAHHSGIEVYGVEYAFEGGIDKLSGLYRQRPKSIPPKAEWTYSESIVVGITKKTRKEVRELLAEMAPNWSRNTYHLIANNCNHFSHAFSIALGIQSGIPSWVNRLASAAETIATLRGPMPTQEELMELPALQRVVPGPDEVQTLAPFIAKDDIQTFNENMWHPLDFIIFEKIPGATSQTDKGPSLLAIFPFTKPLQVTAVAITGKLDEPGASPKKVQFFKNLVEASRGFEPLKGIKPDYQIQFKDNKPQTVSFPPGTFTDTISLGIYIMDNLSGKSDQATILTSLDFIGIPGV